MRDPLHQVSVKYKLAFGFVGLCLLAFGAGGFLISRTAKSALESEIHDRLEFQSQAYATDLHAQLEMLMRRSEDFASDGYIRDHLAQISIAGKEQKSMLGERVPASPRAVSNLREELRRHLRVNKLPLEGAFQDLLIVDVAGEPVVAVFDDTSKEALELSKWAISADSSCCSRLFEAKANDSPILCVATPIFGLRSGKPIGRLLARIRVGIWIAGAMQTDRIGRDRSVEDVSLRLTDPGGGMLIVPPQFLNYREPALTSAPILSGRGLVVMTAKEAEANTALRKVDEFFQQSYPIGDSGWAAEVSIHAARALLPISGMQSEFLFLGVILALVSVLLLYFPLRFLARPIMDLRDAALRIRQGDFSTRVPVETSDELGDLALSFNQMASAVETRTRELESTAEVLQERQAEARSQRDRLEGVISAMQDGVVVLGPQGEVLISNHAADPLLQVFGDTPNAQYTDSRRDCKGYADISTHCRACLSDLQAGARSCLLDIEKRVIEVHATPLAMAGAEGTGRILVGRDVTDRIERDEREIHQERLAVLGEVAAVMAHELNNPLASISMFNQMMADTLEAEHPLRENTDVIARNTETCKRVIAELLGYAADSGQESGLTDLHNVLDDVARFLRPLADRGNVDIALEFEADASMVEADEVQLRQIFVNLVMNAVQAIDGGGRVTVRTSIEQSRVMVDVMDSGPGIPEEVKEEIFRPFFTTKPRGEGTGLGLPTAKRIAEMHGGGLELVSSSTKGTHFRVRLRSVGIEA